MLQSTSYFHLHTSCDVLCHTFSKVHSSISFHYRRTYRTTFILHFCCSALYFLSYVLYHVSYMDPIKEIIYHPLYIHFPKSNSMSYIINSATNIYRSPSIFDYKFYELQPTSCFLHITSCALYVGCRQHLKPRIGGRCLAWLFLS